MLKNFRNIMAFFLAQIVLFSTTSFVIDVHKCDGEIYDISITGRAKSCDMAKMSCNLGLNSDNVVKFKPCCSDVRFVTKGNTIKKENTQFNTSELVFSGVVNNFYNKKECPLDSNRIHRKDYSALFKTNNFNVLYQVFLI